MNMRAFAADLLVAGAENQSENRPWWLRWLLALCLLWGLGGTTAAWAVNAWQPAGPWGGHVRSLALHSDGQTVFAGSYGGVFKSSDGGASWAAASTGLGNQAVLSLTLRALLPQAALRVADNGVWWVESAGGAPLVVRPDWLAQQGVPQPPLVHRIETDATGRVWLSQADGLRTALYAALAEPAALLTLLNAVDAQATAQVQLDGLVRVRLAGQRYLLTPVPTLQPAPAQQAGQAVWLDMVQGQLMLHMRVGNGRWVQSLVVSLVP